MSDEQSQLTDAIQAAYNEAHADFMKAYLLIAEPLPAYLQFAWAIPPDQLPRPERGSPFLIKPC